jgi:predicted metalloprotease with PDZ domain
MFASEPIPVRYVVSVFDARAHLLEVEVDVHLATSVEGSLRFWMPVWTPGSYLVREYARHVEDVTALRFADACLDSGAPARVTKTDKCSWLVELDGACRVKLRYRVYAHDLSVRTCHVDGSHAYWNGAGTYLIVDGMRGARVKVVVPDGWDVATSLAEEDDHVFSAHSIDELLDAPFECGPMISRGFELHGRSHQIRVWENRHARAADWAHVERDTQKIVETELALIAGDRPVEKVIPYEQYTFIWHVAPRGRGGLEHAESCSLLVSPSAFANRTGYLDVLSLIAHEFLHLWNVKRIRPAGLTPIHYDRECYTRLLWWFEGGTSYFDWRILRLAGLCTAAEYATHLAEMLARLADSPGALMHSLSDASFDAWIKAYRPDESSVNTTVSYYLKGEVVCALLDIEIRVRTRGGRSMDDVLRFLWREYGMSETPVPEDAMRSVVLRATGVDVSALLDVWVDAAAPIDVASVLSRVGLEHVRAHARSARGGLGVKTKTVGGRVTVEAVLRGSPAMNAGIEHGDEIVAIAGRRVDDGLDTALAQVSPGEVVQVIVAREGLIEMRTLVIGPPSLRAGTLRVRDGATDEERALLRGWLGESAPDELRAEPKDRENR